MIKEYIKRLAIVKKIILWLTLATGLFVTPVNGATLPDPLTLRQALSYATAGHPNLSLVDAQLAQAVSRKLQVETINDIDAYIELAPYAVIPSSRIDDDFINDSYARLSVSKTLYDFGYTHSLEDSADEDISSQQLLTSVTRNQQYITIMQRYFNVILADLHFAAIDERMTTLYVTYDKLLERHSLGMVADDVLMEAETVYRQAADERKASEKNQFSSRLRLANAINMPEDIPVNLIPPELPQLDKAIPELDDLFRQAMHNNLTITALHHAVLADRAALQASKQAYGPTLTAGLELNKYEREFRGRNDASIGLSLRVPLANGSRTQAKTAGIVAKLSASQARYDQARFALREQLSDLISQLDILKFKRESDKKRLDSRSLTLDKNRALYELEMQTTLGTSMASYTEAEWLSAKNDFEIATIWAQIDTLLGKKLYQQQDN